MFRYLAKLEHTLKERGATILAEVVWAAVAYL